MKKYFLVTMIALILFGCATVTVNKSPLVDFSKYKKVTIVDITNNIGSFNFGRALEGELMSKGLQIIDKNNSVSNADIVIEVSYSYTFIARILESNSNALLATIQSSGPDPMLTPEVVSRATAKKIGELFSQH